ncbi:OmpH family outer membrane protein [Polaribacter cellanae]|uniref:OmpH family outer membrane protein n=1 Tax=Polaribacter cellanae TaxID=2818493 RepID=A0A975CMA2_9FLAO|nr:OmpH family outer membrane protein [Polaribacter cellanae]QTE22253.1 OmpH family outer membrane protein [Polaribacter cellanae]
MKNLKTLLLIAVFTLGVAGVANAQKIAHVDYQRVIDNMPETRALSVTLEKLGKSYQSEIEGMKKKLEAKYQKYTAEQETQTPDTNKKRAEEVQLERARYEQAQQTAYQEMQKKQAEELQPIVKKAEKAIEEVAAAKGILYVFDAKSLIVKKGEDIYDAVKAKLGLLKDKPKTQTKN